MTKNNVEKEYITPYGPSMQGAFKRVYLAKVLIKGGWRNAVLKFPRLSIMQYPNFMRDFEAEKIGTAMLTKSMPKHTSEFLGTYRGFSSGIISQRVYGETVFRTGLSVPDKSLHFFCRSLKNQ